MSKSWEIAWEIVRDIKASDRFLTLEKIHKILKMERPETLSTDIQTKTKPGHPSRLLAEEKLK